MPHPESQPDPHREPDPHAAALSSGDAAGTVERAGKGALSARFHGGLADLVGRPLFWVVFVAAIFSWPLGRAFLVKLPPMLPVLGSFHDFELVDEKAEPFGSRELRGRVWLASVLATQDSSADKLADQLRKVQHHSHAMGTAFHVVCLTSDPTYDTPERLQGFVRGRHGSPRMWSFLTGPTSQVADVLREFGAPDEATGARPILLIDADMRVRARYNPDEPGVTDRLLRDIGLLANRGG